MDVNTGLQIAGARIDFRIQSEVEKIKVLNLSDNTGIQEVSKNLNDKPKEYAGSKIRFLKRLGILECKTCKNKKYQDMSADPGVSFKTPQHLSPQAAASAVLSHEREHIVKESQRAKEKGYEIVSSDVYLNLNVCPECGRVYISGGVAEVVAKSQKIACSILL